MSSDNRLELYRLPVNHDGDGGGGGEADFEPRTQPGTHSRRMYVVLGIFAAFGVILALQLVRYQALGICSVVRASGIEKPEVDRTEPRGNIVDRRGHPLAIDRYVYEIVASPATMADRKAAADRVAGVMGMNATELYLRFEENKHLTNLPLTTTAGPEQGEEIMAWDVFTVTAQPMPRRFYPEGELASQVLGFVNMDREGQYGLEGYYDEFLRAPLALKREPHSPNGWDIENGAQLPDTLFLPSPVRRDLVLTLDRTIQHMAEVALIDAIREHKAQSGTVIVLEPHTSAVLAMASWPDFNPNTYNNVGNFNYYLNPAISALYEPGSVFKLITYAAALETHTITPSMKFLDEDKFVYGERTIKNWDGRGRGVITATEALAQSLNVTTAKIAVELGRNEFYKAVARFGFGQLTGIELQGEYAGLVKTPGKGEWYPADLAINSFGQGISVTPLQMANAVAAIASGGVLHRVHLVQNIIDGNRLITIEQQPLSRAISKETADTLTRMMVRTVNETEEAYIEDYSIAGKSGTAEIPLPNGYNDEQTIVSFGGFFPADDPQFVILVKLDRPKTSRWATQTAAPLFRTIALNLIDLYAIPPDDIRLQGRSN
ncbi:MAG: penicillin-binding protein 2 [Caldilineales bacterium]|nr:penicillin-binding protein 2 [Caldilineales bacterium]